MFLLLLVIRLAVDDTIGCSAFGALLHNREPYLDTTSYYLRHRINHSICSSFVFAVTCVKGAAVSLNASDARID
jgi:hypothetical protein